MGKTPFLINGAGLGLRRSILPQLVQSQPDELGFYEIARKIGLPSAVNQVANSVP